jgi:hypothetical protein
MLESVFDDCSSWQDEYRNQISTNENDGAGDPCDISGVPSERPLIGRHGRVDGRARQLRGISFYCQFGEIDVCQLSTDGH